MDGSNAGAGLPRSGARQEDRPGDEHEASPLCRALPCDSHSTIRKPAPTLARSRSSGGHMEISSPTGRCVRRRYVLPTQHPKVYTTAHPSEFTSRSAL